MYVGQRMKKAVQFAVIAYGAFEYFVGFGEGVTNMPSDSLISATAIFIICTYHSILIAGILSVFSIATATAFLFLASCIALVIGLSHSSWGGPLNLLHVWFLPVFRGAALCFVILFSSCALQ